jgi:hypothetical protein
VRTGAVGAVLLALVVPAQRPAPRPYSVHRAITATVFWIGEPEGNGSSENNAISAWDDAWLAHYGGVDDPWTRRRGADGYFPTQFAPRENPFYVDLPYDDFDDHGRPRPDRESVVPWAASYAAEVRAFRARGRPFSLLKNRWVNLLRGSRICYAQWEDSGPYRYDDATYVFGSGAALPASRLAHRAGIDVSPAVRDCLAFRGLNNDENEVDWQFVEAAQVPPGPWTRVVTTRQVFWR